MFVHSWVVEEVRSSTVKWQQGTCTWTLGSLPADLLYKAQIQRKSQHKRVELEWRWGKLKVGRRSTSANWDFFFLNVLQLDVLTFSNLSPDPTITMKFLVVLALAVFSGEFAFKSFYSSEYWLWKSSCNTLPLLVCPSNRLQCQPLLRWCTQAPGWSDDWGLLGLRC